MPNSYMLTINDSGNLISSTTEAQITSGVQYVMSLLGRYMTWQGTLDLRVDIKSDAENPNLDANGHMTGGAQLAWNGSTWVNQTIQECITGVDSDSNAPDSVCTIYLMEDGNVGTWGNPAWFDPNPQFDVAASIPSGYTDFIGLYTHEIFHSLGFIKNTLQFDNFVTTSGGLEYFTGSSTSTLFGAPLPLDGSHYGHDSSGFGGLMFHSGHYVQNRLDIGQIDLAVLQDLGHTIIGIDGLPLFEFVDTNLNISGGSGSDTLFGDYHDNVLNGYDGNDLLIGNGGADTFIGWYGDDTFRVQDSDDTITEYADSGNDLFMP